MKTRITISTIAMIILLVASVIVFSADAEKRDPAVETQWEYLVVSGGNSNLTPMSGEQFSNMRKQPDGSFAREAFVLERNFDKLGAKGWQLVSIHGTPQEPVFYFKRQKN